MTTLTVKDAAFSVDGSNIQFRIADCEKCDEDINTFWIPNDGVAVLGKSIVAFTDENYAVIFPGLTGFPEEQFSNKSLRGKIHSKNSGQEISGTALLTVAGDNGVCLLVKFYVKIDSE